jgi:hypothetical protein
MRSKGSFISVENGSSMCSRLWANVLLSIIMFMSEYKNPINHRLLRQRVKKRSGKLLSIALNHRLYDTKRETRPAIFYRLHSDPFSKNRVFHATEI